MKKLLILLLFLLSFTVFSQVPQFISYQSIAFDPNNNPIVNRPVGIRISILDQYTAGPVLYSEQHTRTTNSQGFYDLNIGGGMALSGNFSTIPWGNGNKYLRVELDPNGGTNYIATGISQFLSVPYALYSGKTSNGLTFLPNIITLRATVGQREGDVVYVKDYKGNNDGGGGHFVWRINGYHASEDNGGTIIKPVINNPANGRWVRNTEGTTINVKWFGILGDGVTDYSEKLNTLIDVYKNLRGVRIVFPKGIYRLKDIEVPTGFTLSGEQGVSHDLNYLTAVIIRPAMGAHYIFKFSETTQNSCLENLSIDGQAVTPMGKNLIAAVLFNGSANRLYNNNIVYCRLHTVLSTNLLVSRIENNMLQGLFMNGKKSSQLPYGNDESPDNGHLGALHLIGATDCWILNNEIGMSPNYGQLRNNNRKAVAFMGNRIHGTLISGNIIENGDKGAFLIDCSLNRFSNNRYEFNGSNGMEMIRCTESILTGEIFTGNSLAGSGKYDDLVLDTSTSPEDRRCSGLTFINPIFVPGNNDAFLSETAWPRPRHNVTSYAINNGVWKITFIAPYFHIKSRDTDFSPFNTTSPATIPHLIE